MGGIREGGGKQLACWPAFRLAGKVWVRELSWDGCQQLGELYRAEQGVPDMPGYREECQSCQESRPCYVCLVEAHGLEKGWGGGVGGETKVSGGSGVVFLLQEY